MLCALEGIYYRQLLVMSFLFRFFKDNYGLMLCALEVIY